MYSKYGHKINYLIISILCFALYANTIPNFYALDDTVVITNNQFTKKGISGCWEILTNDAFTGYFGKPENLVSGGRYRPLSMISFAIEYQIFGENPHFSHFFNIVSYILLCLLIYKLLSQFFSLNSCKSKYPKSIYLIPLVITILYLSHPVHTEVVANIKGRDELFSFLFSLGTLWFCIKYSDNKKLKYLIFSFLAFFSALMSKENSANFLLIIPVCLFLYEKIDIKASNYKYLIINTIPIFLAFFVFLIIRWKVVGFNPSTDDLNLMNNPFVDTSVDQKYATIFYTLLIYIKLLFIPYPLTVDYYPYHIPIVNWSNYQSLISLAIYIALIIFCIVTIRKRNVYAFGILFYIICLLAVSNLFVTTGTFMGERFLFFSSLGFCVCVGYFLSYSLPAYKNFNNKIINTLTIGIFSIIIIIFSILTINRNFDWKTDFTLFTHDVKISANSAFSNKSAGNHLIEEALKLREDNALRNEYLGLAVQYLTQAVKINPTYEKALFLLGNAHFLYNKDYKLSWKAYRNLLYMNPGNEDLHINIPVIMAECQDLEFQKMVFTELYKVQPSRSYISYYLGRSYRLQNNLDSAVFYLENAIKIDKTDFNSLIELGVAYSQLKNYQLSLEIHEIAFNLDKNNTTVLKNLVILHTQLGNKEKVKFFNEKLTNLKQ